MKNEKASKPDVKLDPMTGTFTVSGDISVSQIDGSFDRNKGISIEFKYEDVDYQEKFKQKREGMHDIVADGDGLTKEMVRDLVMVANKAVWQSSKESED